MPYRSRKTVEEDFIIFLLRCVGCIFHRGLPQLTDVPAPGSPETFTRIQKGWEKRDLTETPALPGLSWKMIYRCCNRLACSSPRQNKHLAGP